MQQTLIILIVSTALIVSVILFLFLLTSTISNSLEVTATIFQGQEGNSKIKDNMKDTKLIALHKTNLVPKVRDYHDILSIDINKVNDNKMVFTIELAGDATKMKTMRQYMYGWYIIILLLLFMPMLLQLLKMNFIYIQSLSRILDQALTLEIKKKDGI